MSVFRRCRYCRRPLVRPTTAGIAPFIRDAHCDNPSCTWCRKCVAERDAAARADHDRRGD